MTIRILCCAIMFLLISTIAEAASVPFLAKGVGSWNGSGWTRDAAGEPKTATRCRLNFNYQKKNSELSVKGKCTQGGRAVRVTGSLIENGKGRYSGQWYVEGNFSTQNMSGRKSGNRVLFTWQDKNNNTGKVENYYANWRISRKRITITFGFGKGKKNILSEIKLRH